MLTAALLAGCSGEAGDNRATTSVQQTSTSFATVGPADWAFPEMGKPAPQQAMSGIPSVRVPDSTVVHSPLDLRNLFHAVDWRPGEHPVPPSIVTVGRPPDVMACGYCHLPNGQGR